MHLIARHRLAMVLLVLACASAVLTWFVPAVALILVAAWIDPKWPSGYTRPREDRIF